MKTILLLLRLMLGAVFIYAGMVKSFGSGQFALALVPFTFIPTALLPVLAIGLPLVEILAGILILPRKTRRIGAVLILLLSLAFIAVLGWALSQDIIVSCGCFGRDETPSAAKMAFSLERDVVFALMAAAVFWDSALTRRTPGNSRKTPANESTP